MRTSIKERIQEKKIKPYASYHQWYNMPSLLKHCKEQVLVTRSSYKPTKLIGQIAYGQESHLCFFRIL